MTNATYNGWTNRETWLVNLHFGDSFQEEMLEGIDDYSEELETLIEDDFPDMHNRREYRGCTITDIASRYQNYVDEILHEEVEGLSMFLSDFLDLELINWYELAGDVLDTMLNNYEK